LGRGQALDYGEKSYALFGEGRIRICRNLLRVPHERAIGQERSIVVASTTETQDSGLFDYLLPVFTQKTRIGVKVLALGTGKALDAGRRGEADVVLTHNEWAEQKFVAEGEGVKRVPVMYNDFVLLGPKNDPAGVRSLNDIAKAFEAIKDKSATFISRGDRSG
jgi:tungstate transport system substrate-binding protein